MRQEFCTKCNDTTTKVELGSSRNLLCLKCYTRTQKEESFESTKQEDSRNMRMFVSGRLDYKLNQR